MAPPALESVASTEGSHRKVNTAGNATARCAANRRAASNVAGVHEASDLGHELSKNRYKTAISRPDYSRPIRIALADGLIGPGVRVFDFGCGLGDDVRHLSLGGFNAWGWDPAHRYDGRLAPAEVVNLGYVVNVIEDVEEREECLARAWSYAEKTLIVSARLASRTPDLTPVGEYGDGFITSTSTFQRFYEQAELKDWVETRLGEPAVAAGPGVFYVFRSNGDRIGFLASRYKRRKRTALPSVQSSIDEHKELLRPLIEFFEERGRAPEEDEVPNGDAVRERFGSLRRALRLVEQGHNAEEWRKIVTARGQDLLLFLALSRFDGRPRFGQLPIAVRRDIKSLFSTYRRACGEADIALLSAGDMQRIRRAAQRSEAGKRTPSAIYVHESALDALPPLLRLYEGCARRYIGRVEEANVIKLHTDEPMVSYLSYPEFEADPHPVLAESLTVHLQTFRLRERDYRAVANPPILHRKERFLAPEHPLHTKFSRLTKQEESKGLFEDTVRLGTRRGWDQVLSAKGLQLRGHRLVRSGIGERTIT